MFEPSSPANALAQVRAEKEISDLRLEVERLAAVELVAISAALVVTAVHAMMNAIAFIAAVFTFLAFLGC